jgi:chaperonin cofactor prefoldin
MPTPDSRSIENRIAALEQQVKDLRARIAALERQVSSKPEHPEDTAMTRQKVTYDWQA